MITPKIQTEYELVIISDILSDCFRERLVHRWRDPSVTLFSIFGCTSAICLRHLVSRSHLLSKSDVS